ncbi:hypothetical protein HanIR_Chr08g0366381 [Helianthus annuus]|nr:hypothetical protein HanIR_Chr08g0366381 [Helianthus annuus]
MIYIYTHYTYVLPIGTISLSSPLPPTTITTLTLTLYILSLIPLTCLPPQLTLIRHQLFVFQNLRLHHGWYPKGDRFSGTSSERFSHASVSPQRDGEVLRCLRFDT